MPAVDLSLASLAYGQRRAYELGVIDAFLTEQRLTFLSFELESSVAARFLSEHPQNGSMTNLKTWHDFEVRHPETFYGMYRFWLQGHI